MAFQGKIQAEMYLGLLYVLYYTEVRSSCFKRIVDLWVFSFDCNISTLGVEV